MYYGAPAAIVVGCQAGANWPTEDALVASQNLLLATHSMGLGSCLIGMAVSAIRRDRNIRKAIDIPDEETAYAVVALGYLDEYCQRQVGRQKPLMTSLEPYTPFS